MNCADAAEPRKARKSARPVLLTTRMTRLLTRQTWPLGSLREVAIEGSDFVENRFCGGGIVAGFCLEIVALGPDFRCSPMSEFCEVERAAKENCEQQLPDKHTRAGVSIKH